MSEDLQSLKGRHDALAQMFDSLSEDTFAEALQLVRDAIKNATDERTRADYNARECVRLFDERKALLAALKAHHEWYTTMDATGTYDGSELDELARAAISKVQQ